MIIFWKCASAPPSASFASAWRRAAAMSASMPPMRSMSAVTSMTSSFVRGSWYLPVRKSTVSIISTALPTEVPSTALRSVSSMTLAMPAPVATFDMLSASSRACATVGM